MRIIWSLRARDDLAEIHTYVRAENPLAAARLIQRIRSITEHLKTTPTMGYFDDAIRGRVLHIPNLPYFICYTVNEGEIEILRVYHTARRRPPPLD